MDVAFTQSILDIKREGKIKTMLLNRDADMNNLGNMGKPFVYIDLMGV